MDLSLTDNVAVIVGGASGIGLACVDLFLSEGASVVIWDAAADTTKLVSERSRCDGLTVDISDAAAVNAALTDTLALHGKINHLVHAAAVGSGKFGVPFTKLQTTDWARVLSVNVQGMANVAHAIAPHMMDRRSGTMTMVSSVAGQIGSPTDPPYSASKAANINFAQVMARDLAEYDVRVNTVCPGMVKTPLNRNVWKSWHDRQDHRTQLSYDDWAAQKIAQLVPLGRWQKADDVANMIVFLSSNRASEVTGQTINVDGGYVMHW